MANSEEVLILHSIGTIVQVVDDTETSCLLGEQRINAIKVMNAGDDCDLAIMCVGGKIEHIATLSEIMASHSTTASSAQMLNCGGGAVLPGLVDAHTHPVFAGDRVHEFAMKLAGATYMEVQAAGGGIHYSTEKTRQAPEEQLLDSFLEQTGGR